MPSEPAAAARQRAKLSIATLGAGLGTLPVPAPSSPRKLGQPRSLPTSPRSPAGRRPTRAIVGARLAPVAPDFAPPPPAGHSRSAAIAAAAQLSLPPLAQRVPAIGGAVPSPRGSPRRTPRGSPRRTPRGGAPAALRKPAAPSPRLRPQYERTARWRLEPVKLGGGGGDGGGGGLSAVRAFGIDGGDAGGDGSSGGGGGSSSGEDSSSGDDSSGDDDEALLLAPVAGGALDAAPLQPGAEQPRRRSDFRSEGRVVDAAAWRGAKQGGMVLALEAQASVLIQQRYRSYRSRSFALVGADGGDAGGDADGDGDAGGDDGDEHRLLDAELLRASKAEALAAAEAQAQAAAAATASAASRGDSAGSSPRASPPPRKGARDSPAIGAW